jgi:hypothetical protein
VRVEYGPAGAEDDTDCYYIWDPKRHLGGHLLGLAPSQIVAMELAEESFDANEHITPDQE